jgi:hypothetical protein
MVLVRNGEIKFGEDLSTRMELCQDVGGMVLIRIISSQEELRIYIFLCCDMM